VDLTILGCSGSFSSAHTQCSGYLLQHDGFNVWMDAGNGTLSELQKRVALDDVGAVVLSHAHPDHCADLYPFFFSLLNNCEPRAVYTPPGIRDKLITLIGDDSKEAFGKLLMWHEFVPGETVEVGPFRIDAFDSAHSATNNTMRISADGKTLCYSGDTGPNDDLARAATDADVFLCESTWVNEQKGIMGPIHLTAGEAGEAARAAAPGRLVLTHIWPGNDLARVRAQAGEHYEGPIDTAVDVGTVTL
jgi:ribonuclease BN (tRNA processing enzyme)